MTFNKQPDALPGKAGQSIDIKIMCDEGIRVVTRTKQKEIQSMRVHEIAELFPMMGQAELAELACDIEANGLQNPIVTKDGVLIDGRNRLKACEIAGVEPVFKEFEGEDIRVYIIGANIHRRHLTESQRAMIAAQLANLGNGQKTSSANLQSRAVSQAQAAEMLSVSPRSVATAKVVHSVSPVLAGAVSSGEISVHAAQKIADVPDLVEQIDRQEITATEAKQALQALPIEDNNEDNGIDTSNLPHYHITVTGRNIKSVTKTAQTAFGKAVLSVEKVQIPNSRSERLAEAQGLMEQAQGIVQDLHDEIESWKDGLPENLQGSSKADELEECCSALDEITSGLDNIDFDSVQFPGMY